MFQIRSHIFQSQVWKLYPDPLRRLLVIETRDYDTLQAAFSAFDLNAGQPIWEGVTLKEQWWIGIEQVYDGNIFFHNFHNSQFASHLNIVCFSIDTKEIIWEKPGYTFFKLLGGSLIAAKEQNKEEIFALIDSGNGQVLKENIQVREYEKAIGDFVNSFSHNLLLPESFLKNDARFHSVNKFLEKTVNISASHTVEYLEYKEHIIISFHINTGAGFANHLLITDTAGTVISDILLDENLKGVGAGTFFIFDNKLIFIKFKKELCLYDL